ncbi:DUF4321 domain-containing protein [Caloranaerobacter sp. TR13]|uniref:DUF4321 domain-containing protein n=1 Tax=Caloranaerobacter sp. TR13 TaxID=1302151 RepID=UPI0006D46D9E|nr:DUF4321 domain-containing protein [Caloranaerobacter sp. TR13]
MRTRNRNPWVLFLLLITGIVIGGIIGDLLSDKIPLLAYNYAIGFKSPIQLDLKVINLTFGLAINVSIASVIGLIISVFIYRKL